jgi:hypothetical protein
MAAQTPTPRAMKTDGNPLHLKINLVGGHGGSSGRHDRLREAASRYTFTLGAAGLIASGTNGKCRGSSCASSMPVGART